MRATYASPELQINNPLYRPQVKYPMTSKHTKPGLQLDNFSRHLFWDVKRADLNPDKNMAYIIRQVLEYGLITDWRLIKAYYGIDLIANVSASFRELDKKALSFISFVSGLPQKEFRCYNYQQSIPQHWSF